jgi:peptide/nickel transport system substrate-binding protein
VKVGPFRSVVIVVSCILAACGNGGGTGGQAQPPRTADPDDVQVAAGEDIWPLTGRGPSSKHFAAGELNVNVYEPLLSLGPDFTLRPGLAERWEPIGDQTWRFHLRQDVRFHDGRPFGADDVVWSWGSREFLPTAVTRTLASVTKVDEHTVDFTTTAPNLRLPEQLVHPEGPIVPRNGHNDATPPVGTGPFRVAEYRPRQRVVVERFDGYWGVKPSVRRITFRFMPEETDRLEALRSGEVDFVLRVSPESVAGLESDGGLRVVRAPPGLVQNLSFNASGQPPSFDLAADRAIRRAVALAVDRSRFVTNVLKGVGEPARTMSPPSVLGPSASTIQAVPGDAAQARAVLDEAGWRPGADRVRTKGGRRLTLTLLGGPAVTQDALQLVAGQLRDVGIEVAVKKASDTTTLEEFRQKGYDLDLGGSNQNDANPGFLPLSRAIGERNPPGFSADGQVDSLLTARTREDAQRAAAELTRTLVTDEFLVVPLAVTSRLYAMRQGVDLVEPHPSGINQYWSALRVGG